MDFARQQRDPTKHLIGIAFVVLIHVIVIYALITGLGRTLVEVIKKPLSATIIEEIKAPPPPPPPPKKIEMPKQQPKIETYVPPPDIPVPTPPQEPVISQVTPVAPIAPPVIAPPPVVEAPVAPPKPAVRKGIVRIAGDDPVYPRTAMRANIGQGRVVARLMIDEKGNVSDVVIVSADPPKFFNQVVTDTLKDWKFKAEGEKYVGEVEINFVLK